MCGVTLLATKKSKSNLIVEWSQCQSVVGPDPKINPNYAPFILANWRVIYINEFPKFRRPLSGSVSSAFSVILVTDDDASTKQ